MAIEDLFAKYKKPNIVIIITDQQRALQHYPRDFIYRLPALKQLMSNGLSFDRAFTAASACAPSRATFLTSQYPAKHKTTDTGQLQPKEPLNTQLPNLAHVLGKAGYKTRAWLGKWHLGEIDTSPIEAGFTEWDDPDAGITISDYNTLGGGEADNDSRYLADMLKFVERQDEKAEDPFCLVASFVNPHDGFVAFRGLGGSGYASSTLTEAIVELPRNYRQHLNEHLLDNLHSEPRAHASASWWTFAKPGSKMPPKHRPQDYVNFYAYLQILVDKQIEQLLDGLAKQNLIDNTLIIRFADHGEMAMSHGLVEKFFNAYEESIRIPFVFSNPVAWPTAQTTQSLASSVDLTPTIASLLGVEWHKPEEAIPATANPTIFYGQDLSPILNNPTSTVQESIHFTYDDNPAVIPPPEDKPKQRILHPSIVRTIRTDKWKYSVYFNEQDEAKAEGAEGDWELYNLEVDPYEDKNLAGNGDPEINKQQWELERQLQEAMNRLGTMPTAFKWPPQKTLLSRGAPATKPTDI
ncbi:MAG: sulfatase-like hydrolase/transferase [Microcoleus sp. PH2017_15_JOR_U_A]|uniref:sulfatase-like hydrolase/transferase n=1 Tax=unclassified Microcoleus TaxID=2642155 RepID=UPI001D84368B|nr:MULTISPECIES: sulfatase-like hydrolase/transferase [unclassified Microcoleus]MCC3474669.1 sulfatase-like hydrolase/transferase [Microcoleus sp. PH2017_13_LAR_U_A]MCC3487161.1 sulfatase-like hydrolase/transferase [Microcoleus sp. PH2017_14_LAR_D_A]MCC3497128.1 sulfatase-like hydrolase/transferase [Microcoleus sp. PH2017_15_JOR_U_A]MCC3599488.1 sulfatase-like hydrolase/transferase [Microcoleus sp. PH2017_26_ELK_O_A]MCC3624518.1 sulfatase-like hydrolase/transferase [Microcoleus sp. PH2017_36_E